MKAKPKFASLDVADTRLLQARSPASLPLGKVGHIFGDSVQQRIFHIKAPIRGDAAFCLGVNEKKLTHLCDVRDVLRWVVMGCGQPRLRRCASLAGCSICIRRGYKNVTIFHHWPRYDTRPCV